MFQKQDHTKKQTKSDWLYHEKFSLYLFLFFQQNLLIAHILAEFPRSLISRNCMDFRKLAGGVACTVNTAFCLVSVIRRLFFLACSVSLTAACGKYKSFLLVANCQLEICLKSTVLVKVVK